MGDLAGKSEIASFSSVLPQFGQVCAFSRPASTPITSKTWSHLLHLNWRSGQLICPGCNLVPEYQELELGRRFAGRSDHSRSNSNRITA